VVVASLKQCFVADLNKLLIDNIGQNNVISHKIEKH